MHAFLDSGFDKRRLGWAAAVVAPLVCVQLVRMMDGGLAQAPAAVVPAPGAAVAPPIVARRLTPEQTAAVKFLQDDGRSEVLQSPMNHPPRTVAAPVAEPTPAQPTVDPVTTLSVTAIMGTDTQAFASIGHTLRRVGDEVAPGWRVAEINAKLRTVLLRHSDGRTLVLQPAS